MESTGTKVEAFKPVFLKAGIPLALSIAGFIFAKITAKRSSSLKSVEKVAQVSSPETSFGNEFRDDENFHSFNSVSFKEDEDKNLTNYEEAIVSLRNRIPDLKEKEPELEMRFLHYQGLNEQESVLKELVHMLLLEMSRTEYLDKKISSMEAGNKRIENLVVDYLKLHRQLEIFKRENGLLGMKVKKLCKKLEKKSCVLRKQNVKIHAREVEILRCHEELERGSVCVEKLKDDIVDLQSLIDQLQGSKDELMKKLVMAEKLDLSISKNEAEWMPMEDYKQLLNEIELLQKDRAAEAEGLIYLRWSNACLRHELMRIHDQQQHGQEKNNKSEIEVEGSGKFIGDFAMHNELEGLHLHHVEPCASTDTSPGHTYSKRRNLMKKFKRWIEGSDEKFKDKLIDGKEVKHEIKCFWRHSVSDWSEEHLARKSCSSA